MERCKHRHKKFIAVTDYRGYPEKIYSCQDCGMMITDFASEAELADFQKSAKKAANLTLPEQSRDGTERRLS